MGLGQQVGNVVVRAIHAIICDLQRCSPPVSSRLYLCPGCVQVAVVAVAVAVTVSIIYIGTPVRRAGGIPGLQTPQ